ncbi:MAG: S1 RNA-binding domain-containing protein, partial [Gammaproteobacteria bacterium]|nr:S1 RNA-binding domain-containing protein [Gammaproteobacteria bacterium]
MTALTGEAEIGQVYTGKVVKIVNFGAFVNLKPGKDGLVHISQIAEYRIESVEAELSEGQTVNVKVLDVDEQGRVKLTMKEV